MKPNDVELPLKKNLPQSWQVQEHDEIDLRALVAVLWHQKILILLVAGLFAIVGVTYAMQAKQIWSAHAVIKAPETLDILPILRVASQATSEGITRFPDNQALYNKFINEFNSYDNQREYLENSNLFKSYITAAQLDDEGQRRWLHDWARLISAEPIDKNGEKQGTALTASADTAGGALNILEGYIDFITAKQQQSLKSSLWAEKSLVLDTKIAYLKKTKNSAERTLKHEIEQVTIAMTVAKASGVERPLENYSTIDRFPITLGSKGLEEKLKVLKTLDLNIYEPTLTDLQEQIDRLKQVNLDSINFRPFSYLTSPEEPLNRDKPKRTLIVVLATLLGGMLGIAIALVRHALRKQ